MRPCQGQENSTKLTPMDSSCGVCAIGWQCDRYGACFPTVCSDAGFDSFGPQALDWGGI